MTPRVVCHRVAVDSATWTRGGGLTGVSQHWPPATPCTSRGRCSSAGATFHYPSAPPTSIAPPSLTLPRLCALDGTQQQSTETSLKSTFSDYNFQYITQDHHRGRVNLVGVIVLMLPKQWGSARVAGVHSIERGDHFRGTASFLLTTPPNYGHVCCRFKIVVHSRRCRLAPIPHSSRRRPPFVCARKAGGGSEGHNRFPRLLFCRQNPLYTVAHQQLAPAAV